MSTHYLLYTIPHHSKPINVYLTSTLKSIYTHTNSIFYHPSSQPSLNHFFMLFIDNKKS